MAKGKNIFSRLKSFVVEIVIIILGVTISFAMNDYDQKKSAEADYQSYLKRLHQDIKIDSLQMANDLNSYRRKVNAVNLIFSYHSGFSQDSIALLGPAQNALLNYIKFLPNDNTFEVLSATGDFKVFSNDVLVSELFKLYRYDYSFIEMMGEEANQERGNLLKPYLIDNIYFEDKLTFPRIKTDIPAIMNDRTFRNICLDYQESSYSAINSYRRALTRLAKVDSLIVSQIEKD